MNARCSKCGKHWNVSVEAKIPKSGYECPFCSGKRRLTGTQIAYIGAVIVGLALTPMAIKQAAIERGYQGAVGGEFLLVPLAALIVNVFKQSIELLSIFKGGH